MPHAVAQRGTKIPPSFGGQVCSPALRMTVRFRLGLPLRRIVVPSICRVAVSLCIIVGALLGAVQLDLHGLAACGDDLFKTAANPLYLQQQLAREERLNARAQQESSIVRQKRELACALVAGRLTLHQAAARFAEVSKDLPYTWDYCAACHPEWSLDMRCAHYVIEEVQEVLSERRSKDTEKIVARLREEKNTW
jgi:hypothetical protein